MLEEILARMAAQRKALNKRQVSSGALELSASDVMLFWFLHTLNGSVVRLDHCMKLGSLPPERVFETLRTCAGQLCTFTGEVDPLTLPGFRLDDLYGCFHELIQVIEQLLNAVIPSTYVPIPLTAKGAGMWEGGLPEDQSLDNHRLFLLVSGARPQGARPAEIGRAIKLASRENIDFILSASLRGVQLDLIPRPPAGAPRRADTLYFRLRTRGQFWDAILRERLFSLHLPGDLAALAPELIAIP